MKTQVRTKEDKMQEVRAILGDAAIRLKCEIADLEWRKDKYGAIHVRPIKRKN